MKKIINLLVLHFVFLVSAQSIDTSFNPTDIGCGSGTGTNSDVAVSLLQPDGKIIIAGNFTRYNNLSINGIARLNTDGSLDTSFNPGTGAKFVKTICIQSDGRIIIGGSFSSYNGIAINGIARLNSDGSLDMSFNPGTGPNLDSYGYLGVYTTAVQSDGKIIIGGIFGSYNGSTQNAIARLDTNGSLDTSFNSNINGQVFTMSIQTDGKIIIGGQYLPNNSNVARLNTDGSLDNNFSTDAIKGAYFNIKSSLIQPDGKIIISGPENSDFRTGRLRRLNTDGSLDMSFNTGKPISYYSGMALQSDGKIIIGGNIYGPYDYDGGRKISVLNIDGSVDSSIDVGSDSVNQILVQIDGKIILCGKFSSSDGVVRKGVARFNVDHSLDLQFNPSMGANGGIKSAILQPDGKIIICGVFTMFNNIPAKNLARLNSDGSLDTGFNPSIYVPDANVYGSSTSSIDAIALQPDGKIIVGYYFTTPSDRHAHDNYGASNIIRLNADGSLDSGFTQKQWIGGFRIGAISIQKDDKIIIGGSSNGTDKINITRLNTNGSLDASFNPGTGTNGVMAGLIQSDGKIIIGGSFYSFNNIPINDIARLNVDSSLDTSFNSGLGAAGLNSAQGDYGYITSASLQPDGKIIICGPFAKFNGIDRNYIARLNSDGSLDTSFNPGMGANAYVSTAILQQDGKIIIGGNFTSYSGIARNYIARLNNDGSLDTSFDPGMGANSTISTINPLSDGKIIIGGSFTNYNGTCRNRIARINRAIEPPIVTSQTFCAGAIVADLKAIGSNLKWYATSDGDALTADTVLTTGIYYVSQTVTSLESSRKRVEITIGTANNPVLPTFDSAAAICSGEILSALPLISINGITGIWSPELDNTKTTAYIFTPATEQCAAIATMAITIKKPDIPSFDSVAAICSGEILSALPSISINGIGGTWSPELDNTKTTDYIFTPTTGQCSTIATMTIAVNKPNTPLITKNINDNNDIVLHSSSISGNQWFDENGIIDGAASQDFTPTVNGIYHVNIVENGCSSADSNSINITSHGIISYELYPNPVLDNLNIGPSAKGTLKIKIYDNLGRCVIAISSIDKKINVQSLATGVYIITIESINNSVYRSKFIKK